MLVIQGYFKAGQFVSNNPIVIPENKKTIVTILDEDVQKIDQKKIWNEFKEAIKNCDEDLPDYVQRLNFDRKIDI